MPDRSILARMDQHMARGNELIAEVRNETRLTRELITEVRNETRLTREFMAEVRNETRLTREFMAGQARTTARQLSGSAAQLLVTSGHLSDTRLFARQEMARLDRMLRDNARIMDGKVDELRRLNDELERQGGEQREEGRAGREALLAILDRLNRLDPPGAPS